MKECKYFWKSGTLMHRLSLFGILLLLFHVMPGQQDVVADPEPIGIPGTVDASGLIVTCPARVGGATGITVSGPIKFRDSFSDVLKFVDKAPGWDSYLLNMTGLSAEDHDESEILRTFNKIAGVEYQVRFTLELPKGVSVSWQDHFFRTASLQKDSSLILELHEPADSRLFIPFGGMHLAPGTYSGKIRMEVYIQPGNYPAGKQDLGEVHFTIPAMSAFIFTAENMAPEEYDLCFRYGKTTFWLAENTSHGNWMASFPLGDLPELIVFEQASDESEDVPRFALQETYPSLCNAFSRVTRVEHWEIPLPGSQVQTPLLGTTIPASVKSSLHAWDTLSTLAPGSVIQLPVQEYDGEDCIRIDISLRSLGLPALVRPGVVAWIYLNGEKLEANLNPGVDLDGSEHTYLYDVMSTGLPEEYECFIPSSTDTLIHLYIPSEDLYEELLDARKRSPDATCNLHLRPYIKVGDKIHLGGETVFAISTHELREKVVEGLYIRFIIIGVGALLLILLILFRKRK